MGERAELGVPVEANMVTIDGVELAVARTGSGPPLVCLHAVGHGGRDFEALVELLSDRFELIRIDWPGQGRSGPDRMPVSAARYSELLIALLDCLGVVRPILLGNSIGGAAALGYARARPSAALVLCNSGGLLPVTLAVRLFTRAFAAWFQRGARGAGWFRRSFAWYYRELVLPSAPAAAQRERIIRAGYELSPLLRDAFRSFAQPEADLRHVAIALDVPVWVAWGVRDRVIPYARCEPCIRRMKNVQITKFDVGHAAFLEQPDAFAREFSKFVARIDVPSSERAANAGMPRAASESRGDSQ